MNIKGYLKNIALIVMRIFSLINTFVPKNHTTVIFFSNNNNFNDNNKALLWKMIDSSYHTEYKIYFSTPDYKKNQHSSMDNKVIFIPTYLAPFIFLRAKFCFYDGGTLKIRPSKSQQVISLWHGIPLKKIGILANEQSSKFDKYNDFTKIIVPHKNLKDIFEQSFGCSSDKILINGYPKNDHLFIKNKQIWPLITRTRSSFKKTILWMPTFRKTIDGRYNDGHSIENEFDLPIVKSLESLNSLNSLLESLSLLFVIKLHPYSRLNIEMNHIPYYSHISLVTNEQLNDKNIINYQFVNAFDGLLTDYSSIYFDYLLLNKPIGFTIDDIESYKNTRGFNFNNPFELMPGPKITNYEELCQYLVEFSSGVDFYQEQRKMIRDQFHQQHVGLATETLLQSINLYK